MDGLPRGNPVGDWVIWVGLLLLVALMVFSALKFALYMPSRARLAEQFERRGDGEAFEKFVAVRPQYMLAAATVRTMSMLAVFLISLGYADTAKGIRLSWPTVVSLLAALLLVLVFGVAVPTAWSKYCGEWLTVRLLPLLSIARVVCYPSIVVLQIFDPLIRRLASVPVRDARSYADELEQEILSAVSEGERHGAVDEEEKEMIESVIDLADTCVEEIMTPRTEVVAIPKESDLHATLQAISTSGYSRIPVYDGTIDTILGVLYAKDLLFRPGEAPFDVCKIMRSAMFVPESKPVRQLLREFQQQKVHLAVVLDEYGGTAGLVTIEDILEELVGEIGDEFETEAPAEIRRIDDGTVEVDARMKIDELNDQLHIALPEHDDYETIGGFIFSRLGKIPRVGEECEHVSDRATIGIRVVGAEPRRVTRLRLTITRMERHDTRAGDGADARP